MVIVTVSFNDAFPLLGESPRGHDLWLTQELDRALCPYPTPTPTPVFVMYVQPTVSTWELFQECKVEKAMCVETIWTEPVTEPS